MREMWQILELVDSMCEDEKRQPPSKGMDEIRLNVKCEYDLKCKDPSWPPLIAGDLQGASSESGSSSVVLVQGKLSWHHEFIYLHKDSAHHDAEFTFKAIGLKAAVGCLSLPLERTEHPQDTKYSPLPNVFKTKKGRYGLFHRTLNVHEKGNKEKIGHVTIRFYTLLRWMSPSKKPFKNAAGLEVRWVAVEVTGESRGDFSIDKWPEKIKIESPAKGTYFFRDPDEESEAKSRPTLDLQAEEDLDRQDASVSKDDGNSCSLENLLEVATESRSTACAFGALIQRYTKFPDWLRIVNTPSPREREQKRTAVHQMIYLAAKSDVKSDISGAQCELFLLKAKILLKAGADVNTTKANKSTPLHEAAYHARSSRVVRFLLENEADASLKMKTRSNYFPLHNSCYNASLEEGSKEVFEILWQLSPAEAKRPLLGERVLEVCACAGAEFVSPCNRQGPCWNRGILQKLSSEACPGSQTFLELVKKGDLEAVKRMLHANQSIVVSRNFANGRTALHYAATLDRQGGLAEQMILLLLGIATVIDHTELELVSFTNAVCFRGRTALQEAQSRQATPGDAVTKALIAHKADPDILLSNGEKEKAELQELRELKRVAESMLAEEDLRAKRWREG
eukprot:1429199-Rhodomonas_salina.1